MRSREDIIKQLAEGGDIETLQLEVILDIRDLLKNQSHLVERTTTIELDKPYKKSLEEST